MNEALFAAAAKAHGLPVPIFEFKFSTKRKWRFDVLFQSRAGSPDVAIEIQGGLFTKGRHNQGAALIKEYEKINEAQLAGYVVLLVTPQQVDSGEVFDLVKRALELFLKITKQGPTVGKR
jgi:hypothetical protein